MIFSRTIPSRRFRRYESYKPWLRRDFEFCCAYCLRPEANFGGEACGEIDHFCPRSVDPSLLAVYENLYWSCRECNGNKGDDWPSAPQIARGYGFVDPCRDDLMEHYRFEMDGRLTPLTLKARYSAASLLLWREALVAWRRETIEAFQEINGIEALLQDARLSEPRRQAYRQLLQEYRKKVSPPVFDRARKDRSPG